MKKIKLKSILKFVAWFVITYILLEIVEYILFNFFHINISDKTTGIGMLTFILIYGFKFHILCCVVPFLVATYKCKHKKCKHTHCDGEKSST